MPQLHIANTFFEHELAAQTMQTQSTSLWSSLHSHPLFLQLQYLPFLYGSTEDTVLVTHAPSCTFLENLERQGINGPKKWHVLAGKRPEKDLTIESWGMSRVVQEWANASNLSYKIPSWELILEANSKAFSFIHGTQLPFAQLLYNKKELDQWMKSFDGPKVLKTCYGLSGRGHLHIPTSNASPFAFADSEWRQLRPVLAEPWVQRVLDFSTQWTISLAGKIEYLGATVCNNDAFGRYLGTLVGPDDMIFGEQIHFLRQQQEKIPSVLADLAKRGFFGHIGVDAMVYDYMGDLVLQPIVEINARKTMGWVALEIARRHFPGQHLRMLLSKADTSFPSLLPHSLEQKNAAPIRFPKQLHLSTDSRISFLQLSPPGI